MVVDLGAKGSPVWSLWEACWEGMSGVMYPTCGKGKGAQAHIGLLRSLPLLRKGVL